MKEYMDIKTDLLQTIILVVLIAFGISLLASSVTMIEGFDPTIGIIIGCILICIVFVYLFLKDSSKLKLSNSYKSFVLLDKVSNEIVYIPRYDFSNTVSGNIKAATYENKALKVLWNEESIDKVIEFNKDTRKITFTQNKGLLLLMESIEYYILNMLSTHLTDYFNNNGFNEKELQRFSRSEIPEVLLSNRFLELFSKSMEEREGFIDPKFPKLNEKVIAQFSNGCLYNHFMLVLPKGSRVKRKTKRELNIDTKKFEMTIKTNFRGTNSVLPRNFGKYYLHIKKMEPKLYSAYKIDVDVNIRFKWRYFFSFKKWSYFYWIDDFVEKLECKISMDNYFRDINWENTLTILESMDSSNLE